jgi:hypothetical protein
MYKENILKLHLVAAGLLLLLVTGCGSKGKTLGEFPDMKMDALSAEKLIAKAEEYNGKNVLVFGTVVTLDPLNRKQLQLRVPMSNTVITVEAEGGQFNFPQSILNQEITVYGQFSVQTYSNVDNYTLARGKDAIPAVYLLYASGIKY